MLFSKETYVRFRNDGVALCKVGGIIILAGEEKDVPFGNISTMSVANGYRNGLVCVGLVVDNVLHKLCEGCSCKDPVAVEDVPKVAEEVVVEPVPVAEEEVPVVEEAPKRGRKPKA
jgi:hypothetical protein